MNPLWLVIIVPASIFVGFCIMALLIAASYKS